MNMIFGAESRILILSVGIEGNSISMILGAFCGLFITICGSNPTSSSKFTSSSG